MTPEQTEPILAVAVEAFEKIQKAYQHIQRFDLTPGDAVAVDEETGRPIKGLIRRAD